MGMKFWIGFVAGLGAAWAALAIWQGQHLVEGSFPPPPVRDEKVHIRV